MCQQTVLKSQKIFYITRQNGYKLAHNKTRKSTDSNNNMYLYVNVN